MIRAWEIARQGQVNFGGNVSEYLSEAMKMAWAEKETVTITTTEGSRNNKSWVAKIDGRHERFGLNRVFINEIEDDYRDKTFILENGIYEVCDAGDRDFLQVVNGEAFYIEYNDVMSNVA